MGRVRRKGSVRGKGRGRSKGEVRKKWGGRRKGKLRRKERRMRNRSEGGRKW
jgi:hypothetical protein